MHCDSCGQDVEPDQHNAADCFRYLNERIENLEDENRNLRELNHVLSGDKPDDLDRVLKEMVMGETQ